jgi:hypothetical protein
MTVSWRRSAKDVDGTMAGDRDAPAIGAPHRTQTLLPSGMSALQFEQTMPHLCPLDR